MEDSRKPLTDQEQIEALIREAEEKIASIHFELDVVLLEGAQGILDELNEISVELEAGPNPQEKQKLLEERKILYKDPLCIRCFATSMRLMNAERRRDTLMCAKRILKIGETLPAAPLPETSALETAALLVGEGSAESASPSSCVSDSTPEWDPNAWLRGLFNMKSKED